MSLTSVYRFDLEGRERLEKAIVWRKLSPYSTYRRPQVPSRFSHNPHRAISFTTNQPIEENKNKLHDYPT